MKPHPSSAAVRTVALAAAALVLAACTTPGPAPSWDGLELREQKKFDAVYVKPNVTFATYKKVILDPVTIKFSED